MAGGRPQSPPSRSRVADPRATKLAVPALRKARRLREALAEEFPEGTSGVVVALGERPVLLEVLAGPRTFARVSRKLLSGYAFETIGLGGCHGAPSTSSVRGFIEAAAKVTHEEHQAVGSGRDIRFEEDRISGYALIGERGVLHAAAFAG